jgi:AraC-like DNA-binding protein
VARIRVTGFEHELGSGMRVRRATSPALAAVLTRDLLGYSHTQAQFSSWLEPPRPRLTLMINLDGSITANGRPLPAAWIGGLSDTYTLVGVRGSYAAIDLKLDPPGAYALLGMPLSELGHECVALEDAFGAAGGELVGRLRDTEDWDARFDLLEGWLGDRVARGPRPAPAIDHALQRLVASAGRVRIEALAAELGVSRRYLQAGFRREIGLAPKAVARQLRFASVTRRIESQPARWADVALDAGYADQSHLNREFRELAGTTPTDFLARRLPEGGFVGDGLTAG